MLMALGEPAEALTEFERSLVRDPNRFRGVYGAAVAAEAAGDIAAARKHYAKLEVLCADRDTERQELRRARQFLASR
jgi:predicted Zn-dependent protease